MVVHNFPDFLLEFSPKSLNAGVFAGDKKNIMIVVRVGGSLLFFAETTSDQSIIFHW